MKRFRMLAALALGLGLGAAVMPAQIAPFGGEFLVNTYTTSFQRFPAIASDRNGGFVVVWESNEQDGDQGGIFGQRYDSSGSKVGPEFAVNSSSTGSQQNPSIAMSKSGRFVVTWELYQFLTSDVFARRFASDGTPLGDDFQVNTYTTGEQHEPVVAMDDAENFVVVWTGGPGLTAEGRRYDAAGVAQGDEFALSASTGFGSSPSVAMSKSGDFVAVWVADRPTAGEGVFGQRFDASGARVGAGFEVEPGTTRNDSRPSVAADDRGNFIVVWSASDGSDLGAFGQRFNRSAEKVGTAFLANTYTTAAQERPSVTIASDGRFLVTWSSDGQDGSGTGAYSQAFDRSAQKMGGAMALNLTTASDQFGPRAAFDGSGFVAVWMSDGQDGSKTAVIGRRQELHPRALAVDSHSTTATSSDANGVLEPGESVLVAPVWSNDSGVSYGDLSGSSPLLFCLLGSPCVAAGDRAATYGTLPPNSLGACDDGSPDACYTISASGPRPGTHWDGSFGEDLSSGGGEVWTLHVGDSFSDVPRSQPFYKKIETMLHHGITSGCGPSLYCPDAVVPRDQMAIFIAKGLAGSGEYVPTTGSIPGLVFGSNYNCAPGGNSLFVDVAPTDSFCRHVHYLAAQNVTLGCGNFKYCPAQLVTRDAMASFIAKALVSPAGGNAIPASYTDPGTHRSYSCVAGSANIHFTDVPVSNAFCKHIHYLWAKGVVDGCSATKYCPAAPVARDAMAKFIANGFGLQLYQP